MSFRFPPTLRPSALWKALAGFMVAAFVFGLPLAQALPALSTVPVAQAQQEVPGGVASQPQVPLCTGAPLGVGIMCTDWGQYNLTIAKVQRQIDHQLMMAAFTSALNALTYFSQTVAYDTAEWVANGFEGQAPGIYTDPFGEYTQKLTLNAAGEFLGTFSDEFTRNAFGLDLCRPPNFPQLALEFQLSVPGLLGAIDRPAPACEWTQITQNWDQAVQSLDNAESIRNIRANFTSGGNDISFGIGAHLAFFDYVAAQREAGIQDRLEGQGYKSVTNFITGEIETPSQLVRRTTEHDLIEYQGSSLQTQTQVLLNNAWNVGIPQLGLITASTFTNVLLSKLLNKLASGLFKSSGAGAPNLLDPFAAPPGSTQPQRIFSSQFSALITPKIIQTEAQDLLTELTACPTQGRTKWNCAVEGRLATAIRQGGGLTVRQAITQGFINENWELIPSTRTSDNQDPSCYTRAFCTANLRKLRLSRVLPIGWELAADSHANQLRCASSEGCVTLKEAIDSFQDCNDQGALDDEHPFCHLVDPNWVLTILPAQCQVRGYGNQLIAGTSQRLAECQDTTTCLRRDANGECIGGYGYCMAEQTFWQFDAPRCEEEYATCRTYGTREGNQTVSYLRSTLDYGSCNAGNVGCMWYALYRDATQENGWTAGVTSTNIADGSAMDRIYFDATVEPCDASGDGCTALLRVEDGQSALNLIPNGSFEDIERIGTDPLFPVGWELMSGNAPTTDFVTQDLGDGSAPSVHGASSWFADPGLDIQSTQPIAVAPFRQYTLSFYARNFTLGTSGAQVAAVQYANDGQLIADDGVDYFQSSTCANFGATERGVSVTEVGNIWTRMSCTFVTAEQTEQVRIQIRAGGSSDILIDGVQLEEANTPRTFVDGINTSLTQVNMKVPPQELQCTGAPDTDNPLCSNYAPVCRQSEAGCQGYRPADGSGAEVPAVLTQNDLCPAACVGYSEYRKQASTFDLVRSPDERFDDPDDDTSAFFVPSSAFMCSAQDVGCELFTNLDAQEGDASQQAFSYLRSCELPGSDTQTYYTWEGSDTSGYQLKTWSLKRDTTAPFPQGPKILERAGPNGVLKNPASCSANTYLQALDPDCRQFYDPDGNVFYRFESQTVLSSASCIQLRKEGSTEADCTKTGGSFNPATSQCVYRADPGASRQCGGTYAGCRAYVGTQGRAQQEVLYEEFATDSFQVATSVDGAAASSVTLARSEESLLVGDTSLRIQSSQTTAMVYVGPMPLAGDALYEISFWAKVTVPSGVQVSIRALDGSPLADNASVSLGTDWRSYRIGPIALPADIVAAGHIPLRIDGTDIAFIDRLRVERVQDIAYVVKDSWNTPAVCDQTPEGIPSPQAMLGCRAYTDRDGNDVNVRQFSSLCRETAIGCNAYVNTRNSVDPYRQNWEAETPAPTGLDPERTSAFGDRYEYYIEDEAYRCREDQLSCRAFGRPNYTQDRLALNPDQPFTTVYLKDNPAAYDDALCSERELFCDAFSYTTDKESGTSYFRSPGEHACEYRRAAVVEEGSTEYNTAGRTYDGWFRVGTDIPCHPDFLQSGSVFGMRLTGDTGFNAWADEGAGTYDLDAGYRGWAGTCPQEASECTELRDVNDTSDPLHPAGRPYYVVNNTQLDTQSCGNRVNPGDGCVLFRDASQPNLTASTAATYHHYQARAYESVDPINCETQATHPSCVATGGVNDANLVIRVQPDRACSAWLACSTAETVFDPQDGTYKSICTDLALCSKAGTPEGDSVPFCANYIDRSTTNETILTENAVINAATYASRPVGFGAQDYAGVTVPDHFQVMDTQSIAIGALLSQDATAKSRLANDYRLTVGIPMELAIAFGPNYFLATYDALSTENKGIVTSAIGTAVDNPLAPYVCVYGTGGQINAETMSIGVMTDGDDNLISDPQTTDGATCWLAVDQTRPAALGNVAGAILVSDNLNITALIQQLEQAAEGEQISAVERGLPGAQCKAAPEADAPFDNRFVLEWDGSVAPPAPSRVRTGYGSSNFCEYGEDCSCTYKRISYGGVTKFYEPLSADVVNAVCVGGPRHGRPCTVDAGIDGSVPTGVEAVNAQDEDGNQLGVDVGALLRGEYAGVTNAESVCGQGGVCTAIQDVELVRGVTGQCLQYDLSRPLIGSRSEYECLVWDPNPLFSGPSDPYHWSPSAGFQPPQTSGRYYCLSPYQSPRTIPFQPEVKVDDTDANLRDRIGFARNDAGTYAGQIKNFWYTDNITSDRSCALGAGAAGAAIGLVVGSPIGAAAGALFGPEIFGCDGNAGGGSLDGARAEGTDMGRWCEEADDDQNPASSFSNVRLVTTGKGRGRGYAEYAILVDWEQIGQTIAGYSPTAPDALTDDEIVREHSMEDAISGFTFSTLTRKLGCAYSEDWVEGVGNIDYDEPDSWKPQDNAWLAGFRAELARNGGRLDRSSAQIVTEDGSRNGTPVKVECVNEENDPGDFSGCYLKTWELNYRAEGQRKFLGFSPDVGRQSMQSLSKAPVYGRCESSHSWFSIRAVFENTAQSENSKDPEDVRPESMNGPFQFVGFWVTACSPQAGPRYIYMNVNLDTADICRELGETISKDTTQSAAFTDRIWSYGTFTVPQLGYQYESTNSPFGASLATGQAGKEPLYMSGVKQAESNVLHPPTFTYSGQTYFRGDDYPKSNWGILSNIFARIYRIYTYDAREVTRDDYACTSPDSPNFGLWCPSAEGLTDAEHAELSREYCGFESKCVAVGFGGEIFEERVCNSFSGVNRGLDCSTDPDICHAGPAQLGLDGVLRTQYEACELNTAGGWVANDNGTYRCTGGDCADDLGISGTGCTTEAGCGRRDAVSAGVFRCGANSALAPGRVDGNLSYCTAEREISTECPREVGGVPCNIPAGETVGSCQGYPWAQCTTSAHCTFTAMEYWPAGADVNDRIYVRPDLDRYERYAPQFSVESGRNITEADPQMRYEFSGYLYPRDANERVDFEKLDGGCEGFASDECLIRNAFMPARPEAEGMGNDASHFFARPLRDDVLPGAAEIARLYPGFVPAINDKDYGDDYQWLHFFEDAEPIEEAPYIEYGEPIDGEYEYLYAHFAACEPKALMLPPDNGSANKLGICRGGLRAGSTCYEQSDCIPDTVTTADRNASANWCNPVTSGAPNYGYTSESDACWPDGSASAANAPNAPGNQADPNSATDNNICTRPAGYWPRASLCNNPSDEYCGLFWYDLSNPGASVRDSEPLPTDTTPGLYTPAYAGLGATAGNISSSAIQDYTYIDYYTPIPPTIAAPDVRTCQGGTCKISGLGSFSVDAINGGRVNGGAGSHIATMRFYAWAAHEQMPLRRVVIDWGDGQQTELPDASLKNHKPYCETEKECAVPGGVSSGLTCQTDSDCPPGTGQCFARGSCAAGPRAGQSCVLDNECDSSAGGDGICQPRLYFGNDGGACEEQFFEFRHVYTCGAQNQPANACDGAVENLSVGRCSGDQNNTCATDDGCFPGDVCIPALPQENGCFEAATESCRFTPRILLIDNWGWCAGECRAAFDGDNLVDVPGSRILHPNGGCYDASHLRDNVNLEPFGFNECSTSFPNGGTARPWVIFPGFVQVQVGATD